MKDNYVKFTQKIKDKWCAALRSDKYEQGEGYMYDDCTNNYCCLGVLGRVVGIKVADLILVALPEDLDHNTKYPTMFIKSDIGIELATMNDSRRSTFRHIADYIDTEIPAES